jgi:hypothetical protein
MHFLLTFQEVIPISKTCNQLHLKPTMEQAGQIYLKTVPVVADVRIGLSWAEDTTA